MDQYTYNGLRSKASAKNSKGMLLSQDLDVYDLEQLLKDNLSIHAFLTQESYVKIFSHQLKRLLQSSTLPELIKNFFKLEKVHHECEAKFQFQNLPFHFDEFYRNLSPVLLSCLADLFNNQENVSSEDAKFSVESFHSLEKQILETLRIQIEEEFSSIFIPMHEGNEHTPISHYKLT